VRITPECDTINSFIICNKPYIQTDPATVFNGNDFIVVWSDARFTQGDYSWIVAARVTTSGLVLDSGYCVSTGNNQIESSPDIAFDDSRCLVVWYNYYPPYGVFGRFINSMAQPEDSIIFIAPTLTNGNINPRVEFDGSNYLVVWADRSASSTDFDVFGQLVSMYGELIGNKILIATGPEHQLFPDLNFDGNTYIIVWGQEPSTIFGQYLATNGQLVGTNFRISENNSYYRSQPGIVTSNNSYFATWSEIRSNESDIYGHIDIHGLMEQGVSLINQPSNTMIITGPLPYEKNIKIYDILGRLIEPHFMGAGIYFIEKNGRIRSKVIKIK